MKEKLASLFSDPGKTILFTGIGNVLRNDDGVGVYVVSGIHSTNRLKTLLAEVSIENYIGRINQMNPDLLVIADCLDFNRKAGYADLVPIDATKEFAFNSHHISLKRLADFFKMPVMVLGIQPLNLQVGENLSPQVKTVADEIIEMINQLAISMK